MATLEMLCMGLFQLNLQARQRFVEKIVVIESTSFYESKFRKAATKAEKGIRTPDLSFGKATLCH